MQIAPIPVDEEVRLKELERLHILFTAPEEVFDRVTRDLARVFEVPVATMSLVDRDVEFYKSAFGVPEELFAGQVCPRDLSICSHVVAGSEMVVVEDISKDERFHDNPVLTMNGARFYAGAPLRSDSGQTLGALCIVDRKVRTITRRERELLQMIADGVMTEVRLRAASTKMANISRELAERNRNMERDLTHARSAQRFLLPPSHLHFPPLGFFHLYKPFDHIGGDFLDVRRRDGGAAMLLADVSGHGAAAALTSAMIKTSFLRSAMEAAHPHEILSAINRDLGGFHQPGTFITAISVLIDPVERVAEIASAGHPHPLLLRGKDADVVRIDNELPLLIEPDLEYSLGTKVQLNLGDRLLSFTDGVIECRDPAGEFMGSPGTAKLLSDASGLQGRELLEEIFSGLSKFTGGVFQDDVALLSAELDK